MKLLLSPTDSSVSYGVRSTSSFRVQHPGTVLRAGCTEPNCCLAKLTVGTRNSQLETPPFHFIGEETGFQRDEGTFSVDVSEVQQDAVLGCQI